MRSALGSAAPAILAGALTVALALLTLLLARVGGTQALGPLSAAGVVLAMLFSLTVLPATLLIAGRRAFWPRIPRFGARRPRTRRSGRWGRLGERVRRAPATRLVRAARCRPAVPRARAHAARSRPRPGRAVRGEPEAVEGQALLASGGFPPAGPDAAAGRGTRARASGLGGGAAAAAVSRSRASATPSAATPGALLGVRLRADPFGAEGPRSRTRRFAVAPSRAGGRRHARRRSGRRGVATRARPPSATTSLVVPAALAPVVLLILIVLLRSLVARRCC